jgi:DNA-binding MarR family transcriptional regulator
VSNVVVFIEKLEKQELVKQKQSGADRRCRLVHLAKNEPGLIQGLFPAHEAAIAE